MKFLLLSFSILLSQLLIAQSVAINTTAASANASSILDVASTTKGLLLPRMTKAQKNAILTPAIGLLVYQTSPDSVGFQYYDGINWIWLDALNTSGWKITGNTGTDTAVNFIGTTDNMPLHLKVNNDNVARFVPQQTNYFIGRGAGGLLNSTARNQIAIGDSAGASLTAIGSGVYVGNKAGKSLLNGPNNNMIGASAGLNVTTGSFNNLIGVFAGRFITTGAQNTFMGHQAGDSSTTALGNTAVGILSMANNKQGRFNTSVGYGADVGQDSLVNASAIGNLSFVDTSNALVLGSINGVNNATANTNVAIGTSKPKAALHVSRGSSGNTLTIPSNRISLFEDNSSNYLQLLSPDANETGILAGNASTLIKSGIVFTADSAIQLRAGGNGTDVHVDKTGRVGIGTTLPKAKLHTSWGSLPNAQYFGGDFSSSIFETSSGLPNVIHLMNTANSPASIHSGTDSISSRSSINFLPDSSLVFRTGGFTQSLTIDKLGTVNANNRLIAGFATNTPPFYKFISTWGSVPSAKYIIGVNGIFESNGFPNVVQLVSNNTNESVIHSGTDSTLSRSSISFQPDSSLSFRTGGFTQTLRIDKLGTVNASNRLVVGTATTTPAFYKLLSTWGSVPGAQYIVGSSGVFESNGFSNVVQLVSDNASESAIHSGTAATQSRSGISFQPDSSLSFRSGGFFERMTIEKNGFIGINNPSPKSLLHIAGTGVNAASSYYFPENNFVVEDTVFNGTAGAITNNTHLIANNNNASSIIAGSKQNPLTSSIVFRNDDRSMRFVTNASNGNGSLTDVIIDSSGRVGIGFTNPATSLGVNGAVTFVQDITNTVNAATVTITVGNRTFFRVNSDAAPASRKLALTNGLFTGQMLIVQCIATGVNGFRIDDADANIDINGASFNLLVNDTITFIWDGNEWIELHRSDN